MKFSPVKSDVLLSNISPLILHFDINKTIIISDPVSNINLDQMLNSLLSECIWGTIKPCTSLDKESCTESDSKVIIRSTDRRKELDIDVMIKNHENINELSVSDNAKEVPSNSKERKWSINDWKICNTNPQCSPPEEGAITFGEFIEKNASRLKLNKKDMKAYKTKFTEKNMIGEKCSESLEKLQKCMRYPTIRNFEFDNNKFSDGNIQDERFFHGGKKDENIKNENNICNIQDSGHVFDIKNISACFKKVESNKKEEVNIITIEKILECGSYHIIPSFFKLISYLHSEKINFRLIFRTFGVDIEKVAFEFNLYCEGKHPLFPLNSEELLPIHVIVNEEESRILIDSNNDNDDNNDNNNNYNNNDNNDDNNDNNNNNNDDNNNSNSNSNSNSDFYNMKNEVCKSVQRVKMDGSSIDGIDRRLHLPYNLGVLKRFSCTKNNEESISMEYTTAQGVRTVCKCNAIS